MSDPFGIPLLDVVWEMWWAQNRPKDWWAKERGEPLSASDRARVTYLARRAYDAGRQKKDGA